MTDALAALMKIHGGLPRQGPGSDRCTLYAVSRLPLLPTPVTIADFGCGPGRASLVLARTFKKKVLSLDLQESFLNQLRDMAEREGISDLIDTRCGDMGAPEVREGSLSLIWSEGAIYCVGFDRGLALWRPLLALNGVIACTELSWLVDSPSSEPERFWQSAYPAMRSIKDNILAAESLGFACVAHFTLPESCWWDEYYAPLSQNIERLKRSDPQDTILQESLCESAREIDLYRRFKSEYGYEFYILQRSQFRIERASTSDAKEIAQVFRESFKEALPFIPTLHSADEDLEYFQESVLPSNEVLIARDLAGRIAGFIAFDQEMVNQLYLLPQYGRCGLGTRLLNLARAQRSRIRLWSFQKNEVARRFYTKHGFVPVMETDGAGNEVKEPDILFEWVAPPAIDI